jgi:hypothetical protein
VTTDRVYYSDGYRWLLREDAAFQTYLCGYDVHNDMIALSPSGFLLVKRGYATDGVTGITGTPWAWLLERPWLRRGSFGHDAIYQLIRLGLLPRECKKAGDQLLHDCCLQDGAWAWQADFALTMVRRHGQGAVMPSSERPVLVAP